MKYRWRLFWANLDPVELTHHPSWPGSHQLGHVPPLRLNGERERLIWLRSLRSATGSLSFRVSRTVPGQDVSHGESVRPRAKAAEASG